MIKEASLSFPNQSLLPGVLKWSDTTNYELRPLWLQIGLHTNVRFSHMKLV